MGSYYMEDARRYSGYDEYAGIFGPLQASSSHGTRTQRRLPPSRRRFADSGALAKLKKGRRPFPRNFERRAKFLADRKAKNYLQSPLADDSDGADDLQDQETHPASPTRGLQRQVWLPTRNFAFRQRAGKLDIRSIARLDLEKIAATTDIETIQRHLENLAFADVTLDDVQHYSDAYFLKLFQIAQLTLEYLMHVQDSLVDHSEGIEKQCDQLLAECQQLETENGQHEMEITSLKREIRQKQRTMATLELMLLNASASTRINSLAKENAAKEANVMVDELLATRTDPEEGIIANPVTCVLCGKRFVSAEYLLRHQERRHQNAMDRSTKKNKVKSSSGSSSDSEEQKKTTKPTQLPKEIVDALEEKNQIAKQLMILQDQVRIEQESRDQQRQQIESQQNHLSSRMEHYMEKLQGTLIEIEKKQEATKQDLRQYTQESIARIQLEAANAELLRVQQQKSSRAGRLENDDENRSQSEHATARLRREDTKWAQKVEKLMETFLKAQAQKQQEIDALEQESNKLWNKYTKLKKKKQKRPEPTMMLADLTVLDADRFGVDHGEIAEVPKPVESKLDVLSVGHVVEDKLVQTDDEDEGKSVNRTPPITTFSQEVQTELEEKGTPVASVVIPAVKVKAIEPKASPPPVEDPPNLKENVVLASPAPVVEIDSKQLDTKATLQQAAHVIGKVALGFLTRRTLENLSNWRIIIEISSLESSLTAAELEYARKHYINELHVPVEEEMTANDLRVRIAKVLTGKDEFQSADKASSTDTVKLAITATMTYHRVLLHHKYTGVELCGDTVLIHEFKNAIDIEIIPYHETAATQIDEVVDFHAKMSDLVLDIRRASLELSPSDLRMLEVKHDDSTEDSQVGNLALVRLQALVRGFIAKKKVELIKIDRLVDVRLVKMSSEEPTGSVALEPSWMSLDPVLAVEYKKIQRKLAEVVRAKLGRDGQQGTEALSGSTDEGICDRLPIAEYEKHTGILEAEENALPADVQRRSQLLTERISPMATGEYRRKEADAKQRARSRIAGAAAKIHRAVQVEVVRKRLKRLLAEDSQLKAQVGQNESTSGVASTQQPTAMNSLLSSWLANSKERLHASNDKSLGSFDRHEIDQLANAYEEGKSPVELPRLDVANASKHVVPASGDNSECKDEKQHGISLNARPLTPRAGSDDEKGPPPSGRPGTPNPYAMGSDDRSPDAGRSPRPDPNAHVISPFSKTPLISRRAGAAARRGTGYYNAR